jgi:hypothetical protein
VFYKLYKQGGAEICLWADSGLIEIMPAFIVGWCIVKDNAMFLVHFDIEENVILLTM